MIYKKSDTLVNHVLIERGDSSMRSRKFVILLVLVLGLAAVPGQARAEETGALVVTKLFRGIANTATGWMEIPKQISVHWQEEGPGVGTTWGLVKGVGLAVARTAAGVFEIVTFPFPTPDHYAPVMTPEYVLEDLNTKGGTQDSLD